MNLEKININRTHLTEIQSGLFDNCGAVTYLNLNRNKINRIAENALDGLSKLKRLVLLRNRLKEAPMVASLLQLTMLDLTGNPINVLDVQQFQLRTNELWVYHGDTIAGLWFGKLTQRNSTKTVKK